MVNKNIVKIHHVGLTKFSMNISGGEVTELNLIKYLNTKEDIQNIIYTSESGLITYKKLMGFSSDQFIVIGKFYWEKISEILAYFIRVFEVLFYLKKFDIDKENIIISHEEFLPTILYSFFLHLKNPQSKWILFYHMKAPHIFKGYEGEFINKFHFPGIKLIRYNIEQQIAFFLSKKIDLLITVNPYYRSFLEKKYNENKIFVIEKYGGVTIPDIKSSKKVYDGIWVGRFHPQKGLFDLITIVKNLKKYKNNVKIIVLGGGNKKMEQNFNQEIKKSGLSNNIEYKGFVMGNEKILLMMQSKIFLMTSYFESFGHVNLEAMKCGLPVVAYDLPIFNVFSEGMVKVTIQDKKKYSNEVYKLLTDKLYYDLLSKRALKFSSEFSWDKTSQEIYEQLKKVL